MKYFYLKLNFIPWEIQWARLRIIKHFRVRQAPFRRLPEPAPATRWISFPWQVPSECTKSRTDPCNLGIIAYKKNNVCPSLVISRGISRDAGWCWTDSASLMLENQEAGRSQLYLVENPVFTLLQALEVFSTETSFAATIDSHAVRRKNTEGPLVTLYPASANSDVVQNPRITPRPGYWHCRKPHVLFRFPQMDRHASVCLYSILHNFISRVGSWSYHGR